VLIDGRSIPFDVTLRSDVVVVGAGPAGITVAEALTARGLHVLLVEAAGRRHGRADDDALDGDGSGEPFPLQRSRHRGFGGTSTHWTAATGLRVRPLDAIDFRSRPGRPSDSWPFSVDELATDYERAYASIGLQPDDRPQRWFGDVSPTALAWDGGPQLAMFQFADHDCFTRRFDAMRTAPLVDLLLHSTVERLVADAAGEAVEQAAVVTADGGRFRLAADTFVLACGGIDNARLLLNSPGREGCPIGNEHDNVGRYFMDHLSVDTGVIEPIATADVAAAVFREHGAVGTPRFQPMLWLGDEIIEREGIANAAFWVEEIDPLYRSRGVGAARSLRAALNGRPRRDLARHAARTFLGAPSIAAYAARRRAFRGTPLVAMRIMSEQLPNRNSRVALSTRHDKLGMPRVDIDWRITATDLDVIVAHQRLLGRLLAARGVAALTDQFHPGSHPSPVMSNFHHLGTTRMHRDPRHGVVDADSRVHSSNNLYVAGSSVFPTGGYLNPTLTIIALAYRIARTISDRARPTVVRPVSGTSGVARA
jgi:choline dehydrogenase-like flavoprotein